MRQRLSAALLAVIFSFGLIAPLVSAPASAVPACCRNKGKHGCHGKGEHNGPVAKTARCAEFPTAQTLPAPITAAVVATSGTAFCLVAVAPVVSTTAAPRPVSFESAHSERGPPSLLA